VPIPLPFRFDAHPLLWTVPNIYSPAECRDIIQKIDAAAPTLATNNPLHRNQDRVMVDDHEAADDLFSRLEPHLPKAIEQFRLIGLNERLRYYRYAPGQEFIEHMDHWYRPSPNRITLHTVLVYFNGDFTGGETRFSEQLDRVVIPEAGLVAIFQHKVRHEGCRVTSGVKYAMRTELLFEAPGEIGSPTSLPIGSEP
jgi:prolyl 4-hydroxylase